MKRFTYMGDVGQVGPASPAFRRKGVLIPADRSHKKRQLNFMVWKLGQRSLYCPEHLSFRSLGKKNGLLVWKKFETNQKRNFPHLWKSGALLRFSALSIILYSIIKYKLEKSISYESFIHGCLH